MGYPGDEGGGPPDSRLGSPGGRSGGRSSGSHRRPGGSSYPGTTGYSGTTGYPGTTGYQGTGRRGLGPAGDSEPGRGGARTAQTPPAISGGPSSRENAWRRPDRRPGQEIQGGPGNGRASGGSSRGSLWSTGAFRTAGPSGRGPVRGFPPAPGAPDPVYPPGQFSPWNGTALRAVGAVGRPGLAAGSGTEASEPEYSLLAVSDPSADATATQTWAVLDDPLLGHWSTPPSAAVPARPRAAEDGLPGIGEGTPSGPPGFFEAANGPAAPDGPAALAAPTAPAGYAAPTGHPGQAGTAGYPGETGYPGEAGYPGKAMDGDSPEHPVVAGYRGQTDPSLRAARPGGRLAARQSRQQQDVGEPVEPDTGAGATGGSRSAARGRKPRKPRKPPSRARMWLMPLVMMVIVIILITVAYLHFAKGQVTTPVAAPAARQGTASSNASPSLGPWKHITTRAEDPTALSLTELFPSRYAADGTVVRAIQQAGRNCPGMVVGNRLQAVLHKAGCTQVMRASYLSAGQKIMATIGVLNLANVTDAERAGNATGATAFIKQLPTAHGPTKNLMKGTGLEEAQIKGHYLILTWAEFTNLRAPRGAAGRTELDTFSRNLVANTAGISLTSRMVFGKPQIP